MSQRSRYRRPLPSSTAALSRVRTREGRGVEDVTGACCPQAALVFGPRSARSRAPSARVGAWPGLARSGRRRLVVHVHGAFSVQRVALALCRACRGVRMLWRLPPSRLAGGACVVPNAATSLNIWSVFHRQGLRFLATSVNDDDAFRCGWPSHARFLAPVVALKRAVVCRCRSPSLSTPFSSDADFLALCGSVRMAGRTIREQLPVTVRRAV